ncbi:ribonuclease Z [Deinococcus aetherius]|uniref:Ribonuclease Z n=1 Tax=Deinococcus aetherius TaxID=200252 RepID=A0ABN6RJV1_9DEIO|nr:MBL fold metallo-hydrolase [Deinococcus aetherius]BDP42546.1 ribonuclease Z [Deinococcus aetherius]
MLRAQVLGSPAEDNALWVTADTGQGQTRLLLDCGARTLDALPLAEVRAVDHVLFSHLHMDHVAGFDDLFRAVFDRPGRQNHVWGPPGTARILAHRFRGYWWNHAPELSGTWHVHDVDGREVRSFRFELHEAFEVAHEEDTRPVGGPLFTTPEVSVEAVPLRHQGVCLGYVVREPERVSVDASQLAALGLKGGPWLAALKAGATGTLDVGGTAYDADDLRARLLRRESGDSLAYLTDFRLDADEQARLAPLLTGVETLYAEAQYLPEDTDLARRNDHTTAAQVAALARAAGVGDLCLLHLSRRYRAQRWPEFLSAARAVFPRTHFPAGWPGGETG